MHPWQSGRASSKEALRLSAKIKQWDNKGACARTRPATKSPRSQHILSNMCLFCCVLMFRLCRNLQKGNSKGKQNDSPSKEKQTWMGRCWFPDFRNVSYTKAQFVNGQPARKLTFLSLGTPRARPAHRPQKNIRNHII